MSRLRLRTVGACASLTEAWSTANNLLFAQATIADVVGAVEAPTGAGAAVGRALSRAWQYNPRPLTDATRSVALKLRGLSQAQRAGSAVP